jgi:hypothetical protein
LSGTHQLRHFYASVTLADGVSIKELAEYLGHKDPGFTLRTYAHMLPSSYQRARNAIDACMKGHLPGSDGASPLIAGSHLPRTHTRSPFRLLDRSAFVLVGAIGRAGP